MTVSARIHLPNQFLSSLVAMASAMMTALVWYGAVHSRRYSRHDLLYSSPTLVLGFRSLQCGCHILLCASSGIHGWDTISLAGFAARQDGLNGLQSSL
ncbi:hypothetical protein F4860DRAFT_474114 [Xylaria cubensis]|nr:hypothetical protein F4860DRAFT_474114 [Xylaria cubensis]